MKKNHLILIVIAAIIAVAIFTNPDLSAHKEAAKAKMIAGMQKAIKQQTDIARKAAPDIAEPTVSSLFGEGFVDKVADNVVSTDNYLLFSTTKITWAGHSRIVGVGAFGNVYISNKINEMAESVNN
jgi:hypothetical protein